MISDVEHVFMCLLHLYFLFRKISVQVFCPFFKSGFCSCNVELYELFCMLDINPILVTSFTNIFPDSVGCFSILSMLPFAVQKLLSLSRSHSFIFAFISFILGDKSKKKYGYETLVTWRSKVCDYFGRDPSRQRLIKNRVHGLIISVGLSNRMNGGDI